MYKYKNITESRLTVVGVGQVDPGQTIESEELIISPNLEMVPQVAAAPEQPAPVVAKEVAQPAVVTNAAPVVNEEAN